MTSILIIDGEPDIREVVRFALGLPWKERDSAYTRLAMPRKPASP